MNIGALALDPADPNIVYAGTGEQYDSRPGAGIFKGVDAGATWTQLPSTATASGFRYINRVILSPNNSRQMYVASSQGVFASKDSGTTWTLAPLNASYYGCQDLVIRTDQSTDYLYAACSGNSSTATFAVWRNTDAAGAGAWASVFTAPNMGRTMLGLAPSQQSTIYAAAAGLGSPASPRDGVGLAGVFRSISNGDPGSWATQVSGTDPDVWNTLLFSNVSGATSAFCANGGPLGTNTSTWGKMIAVDPLDPNRVWVGGVDLFRSDDGGLTWGLASRWDVGGASQYSHADRHLPIFAPGYDGNANQTAFHAADGGVFRTDNARAAVSTGPRAGCTADFERQDAVAWVHIDNSYVATQFYKGVAYPGGATYFGGAQDNGVSRGSDGGLNGFASIGGGDGGSVAIDPADSNRLFLTSQTLALRRSSNGIDFASATAGITENATSFPFEACFAMDPNDGRHVFLGGTKFLWRGVDEGVSWSAAAPVETNGAVSSITVSPFDSNTAVFGTTLGYIYTSASALTSDGTAAWSSARPRPGYVARIAFDPTNPPILYATYSTLKSSTTQPQVYRSIDGGQTWTPSDGSGATAVPDIGTWRILVDPRNSKTLYLGTDLGLLIFNRWRRVLAEGHRRAERGEYRQ